MIVELPPTTLVASPPKEVQSVQTGATELFSNSSTLSTSSVQSVGRVNTPILKLIFFNVGSVKSNVKRFV